MIYALRTNIHRWQHPKLERLDVLFDTMNVSLIDMQWNKYKLVEDDLHFTLHSFKLFCEDLALSTQWAPTLVIYADSTIDYWNYNMKEKYTNLANKYIASTFKKLGVHAIISAVNGSGFVCHPNFMSRCMKTNSSNTDYLFIGGWNDITFSWKRIETSCRDTLLHHSE